MSKVSIIIPVYNAQATIKRCLDAILAQTYENLEAICINDGSKDDSLKILEEYSKKDSRIKVLNQENQGPAMARYNGIEKASGEYLMFCDADDWYEKTMVEKMVETIKKENTDIVMCDCNVIDLANETLQNKNMQEYNRIRLLKKYNLNIDNISKINVILWNKIFKIDFLKKYNITYPKKYEHDDLIFIDKILAHAKTYYGLNEKLYNYTVGNVNSIMGKLYTKNNLGKELDFINAFDDLFEYLSHYNNQEYNRYIKNSYIGVFQGFVKYLSSEKQQQSVDSIKDKINTLDFFKEDNPLIIEEIKKFKTVDEILRFSEDNCVSFIQKVFSIKNSKNRKHKIIRILGVKIKIKRKHYVADLPVENNSIIANSTIKILVAYHKKTPLIKNDICIPIHCGRKIAFEKSKDGIISEQDFKWLLDNLIGDDTGDNISHLNRKFNEMTAIYWAWKNYDKLDNPDYIGFMHYRTIFCADIYPNNADNFADSNGYTNKNLEWQLHKYKFLCTSFFYYDINSYEEYKSIEQQSQDIIFYDTLLDILKEKYPNDYKDIKEWNNQRVTGPYKNMFITSKEEFFKYCEWIFPKLFELDERLKDYSYQKEGSLRSIAWLSEMLTAFYFWRLGKTCEYKEFSTFRPFFD